MVKRAPPHRDKRAYQKAEQRGKLAEYLIYCLYAIRGWRLIGRRYRTPFGEIDLITKKGAHYCFIEVKYRAQFHPSDSPVPPQQLGRLQRACHYAYHRLCPKADAACQFDVVVITRQCRLYSFRNIIDSPQHLPHK